MCSLGAALGVALGAASSAASVAAQNDTAKKNQQMAIRQQRLEYDASTREYLVEKRASLKEAHDSFLEAQAAKSGVAAAAGGMQGLTVGARMAEQGRQGALNIFKAQDRAEGATANFNRANQHSYVKTQNYVATQQPHPLSNVLQIATGAVEGYSQFRGSNASTPAVQEPRL